MSRAAERTRLRGPSGREFVREMRREWAEWGALLGCDAPYPYDSLPDVRYRP